MKYVTINRERLKALFRDAFFNALKQREGPIEHTARETNGSSPPKWWINPSAGSGNRTGYYLYTSGNFTVHESQNAVQVDLVYTKTCRPDNG